MEKPKARRQSLPVKSKHLSLRSPDSPRLVTQLDLSRPADFELLPRQHSDPQPGSPTPNKGKDSARSTDSQSSKKDKKALKPSKLSDHSRLQMHGADVVMGNMSFALKDDMIEIEAILPVYDIVNSLFLITNRQAAIVQIILMDKYYLEWERKFNRYTLIDERKGTITQRFVFLVKYSPHIFKWLQGLSYFK